MKLDNRTLQVVAAALQGKRGADAKAAIADLAASLGVSQGYLYRLSQGVRATGRARRADAGARRITLAPEVEDVMQALTVKGDLSADMVVWTTARHFGLPADFISLATYNQWLRGARLSRRDLARDLRPARRFEAAAANDLHHFDTTVAESVYINDDGTVGYEPTAKRNKNKPGNRKPRQVLYAITDDYSRVIFARFYLSDNALNLIDFLRRAWSQKEDKRFPFFGLPLAVYCDLGPSNVSGLVTEALAKLGVQRLDTLPSNATRHGSRKHGKIERAFGGGLLLEFMKFTKFYKFAAMDEQNEALWEWLIHTNNRTHSMTREKRFARWLTSVGTPRNAPSDALWWSLTHRRRECTVDRYLCIKINGHIFQLPQRAPYSGWALAKVEVYWHPDRLAKIHVVHDYHEEEIDALPPVIDRAGDYKGIAATPQQQRLEELDRVDLRAINVPALWNSNLPYLPKKAEPFEEARIATKTITTEEGVTRPSFAAMRWLSRFEVARDVRAAGYLLESGQTDMALVDWIMDGREQITDDDLSNALTMHRAKTGTEDY